MNHKPLVLLVILVCLPSWKSSLAKDAPSTRLEIAVDDADGQSLPCRIHLLDRQGNAQKVDGQPFWHDHFVCSGRIAALLAPGKYDYAIERGPEYLRKAGQVAITAGEDAKLNVTLERIANLRASGWYSGDLHVHRPVAEIEHTDAGRGSGLCPGDHLVEQSQPVERQGDSRAGRSAIRRPPDLHRHGWRGRTRRRRLLYFGLKSPLNIATDDREFPSPMQFVEEARRRNREVWIDIEKPFWWDVPVWLASGQMNSIGIANNHMCRSRMYPSEAWGKPRDATRLPEPRGNGFWTQEIYYHMLNTGLRLPPSAGSASGVLPNPVGYNRVYVHLDEPFTCDAWFRGLSRGRCFVTNGPLLLVTADGQDPGATIKLQSGERRTLRINVQLTSQDPISRVELIKNGNVSHIIKCSDELTQRHTFEFSIDEPGWFLIRAIADVENTFRFATTAPWFVEVGGVEHRISRRSVQFFLDWVNERIERVKANIEDGTRREQVLVWHEKARTFWTERLKIANAE